MGEAANPGPLYRRVSDRDRRERVTANRFVVLSSDDEEEWVPPTVVVS